jgi:GcrA cell cycle regulator
MEWNEETIAQLRALWMEGHSTAEIGRRMGITKNAVVGKAHRLKLSSRPSPIRRDRSGDVHRPRPVPRAERIAQRPRVIEPPAPVTPRAAPVLRQVTSVPFGRVSPCCWPIGEPGTRTFRFCDADTLPNKPYCGEHAQLAYVKIRDKRESAA